MLKPQFIFNSPVSTESSHRHFLSHLGSCHPEAEITYNLLGFGGSGFGLFFLFFFPSIHNLLLSTPLYLSFTEVGISHSPLGTMDLWMEKKQIAENLLLDQELQEACSSSFQKATQVFRHCTRK